MRSPSASGLLVTAIVAAAAAAVSAVAGTWREKPWLSEISTYGDNATLRCVVLEWLGGTASNVSEFTWYGPGGDALRGAGHIPAATRARAPTGTTGTGTSFIVVNTGQLYLSNVQANAVGWYLCQVIKLDGNVTMSKAWLVKRAEPDEIREQIRQQLVTGSIVGGSVLGLLCSVCLVYKYRYKSPAAAAGAGKKHEAAPVDGAGGGGGPYTISNRRLAEVSKCSDERLSTSTLEMIVSHDYQTDTVSSTDRKPPPPGPLPVPVRSTRRHR